MKTKKPSPPSKATINTAYEVLFNLTAPKAEIVIHDNISYLLNGKHSRWLNDKVYDYMLDNGWITHPVAIDKEHARCLITPEGRAYAIKLEENRKGFIQGLIDYENPENQTGEGTQPEKSFVEKYQQELP